MFFMASSIDTRVLFHKVSGCGLKLLGAAIFKKKEKLSFGFKSVFWNRTCVCIHENASFVENRIVKRLICTT